MNNAIHKTFFLVCLLLAFGVSGVTAKTTVGKLYQKHCAQCHGKDRLGGMGEALLPGNLTRLPKKKAATVIR
ncbi:MAG TPA: cytochrome C oxidase Cbb3, partial [Gammaproteobacteria bacterium]|nr:cytochrome C oxidase Cbb3 [Gammaproteobacteria bacterium]